MAREAITKQMNSPTVVRARKVRLESIWACRSALRVTGALKMPEETFLVSRMMTAMRGENSSESAPRGERPWPNPWLRKVVWMSE